MKPKALPHACFLTSVQMEVYAVTIFVCLLLPLLIRTEPRFQIGLQ